MKRILLMLVIVAFFQDDHFAQGGVIETQVSEVPIPRSAVVVGIFWQRYDGDPGDLNSPKLVSGNIYSVPAAGRQGGIKLGIPHQFRGIPRRFLAHIDRQGSSWRSVEMAYRQAVEHTRDITKIGTIDVNYFVDATTSHSLPDWEDAPLMAVNFMALFRREVIDERSILLGTLQPDGRIGPALRLSEKAAWYPKRARQILIPPGQLMELDPTVLYQLQQQSTKVLEVDNLEQAYQLMVKAR